MHDYEGGRGMRMITATTVNKCISLASAMIAMLIDVFVFICFFCLFFYLFVLSVFS